MLHGCVNTASEQPNNHLQEPVSDSSDQPDPLTSLEGLLDVFCLVDAAIMQNIYLKELVSYRDIKHPAFQEESTDDGATGEQKSPAFTTSLSCESKLSSDVDAAADDRDEVSVATVRAAVPIWSQCISKKFSASN